MTARLKLVRFLILVFSILRSIQVSPFILIRRKPELNLRNDLYRNCRKKWIELKVGFRKSFHNYENIVLIGVFSKNRRARQPKGTIQINLRRFGRYFHGTHSLNASSMEHGPSFPQIMTNRPFFQFLLTTNKHNPAI